ADNALVKAAGLIERLGAFETPPVLLPEVEGFLAAVADSVPPAGEALGIAQSVDPIAAELIEPLLAMTVSPTMIHASDQRNVIPELCQVSVDCRLLPGQTVEAADRTVREWLGEGDYEIAWEEAMGGTHSELATPLWSTLQSFVASIESGARVAPF